jgi:hypothetical protein
MSSIAAALGSLAGQSTPDKLEYNHGSLQIRAKTLVIGNSIYPIDNISTVAFADLRNPVPQFVWILLGVGVLCTLTGVGAVLGLPLVGFAIYLIYLNHKSRAAADYALNVQMNSGNVAAVMSNNGDFLKAIALELYEVIELEQASYTTFNLDQSVKIDNITGSAVAVGSVRGDIVNNVLAA